MELDYDVIIIGAGLVGLSAALSCAHIGQRAALIDAREIEGRADKRASALTLGSYNLLGHLGLHDTLGAHLSVINKMHIMDAHIGKVSPFMLEFNHAQEEAPAGYMIENEILREALLGAAAKSSLIDIFAPADISGINRAPHQVSLSLQDQTISAALLIAADGRGSALRARANIASTQKTYNQKALVTTFAHSQPHDGIAYQYFYAGGPLALLPLTGNRMSIVWTDRPAAIDAAMALPEPDFVSELMQRFEAPLGEIMLCAPRQSFPLSLQIAQRYTDNRLALIGDAAHAIHPLAGQGLNLGLRDVAALADAVLTAQRRGQDIGLAPLAAYERWRRGDAQLLATATDTLNTLFSNTISPLRHARRLGLSMVNSFSQSKTQIMQQAGGAAENAPKLLRAKSL